MAADFPVFNLAISTSVNWVRSGFSVSTPTIGQNVILAAQYLRMSTGRQRHSAINQSTVIAAYAAARGMEVVRTYSDPGRSGLKLAGRPGLGQLIQDVVSGTSEFDVILVYDVSRWGRFQDVDESAHFEFLCRQAGFAVHYCAETFDNDGGPTSDLLKGIKRLMAGEYSRELSVKVSEATRRISALGFRTGGTAGIGLRRWLVDEAGDIKRELAFGERKGFAGDRVILRPGPPEEIAVVKRIYQRFLKGAATPTAIARELNDDGLATDLGRAWTHWSVQSVLRSEKYAGDIVYGRKSSKLQQLPKINNPPETWVRVPNAFEPIISRARFLAAQRKFDGRARLGVRFMRSCESAACNSDDAMLQALTDLLNREGYLSHALIRTTPGMPSVTAFRHRFGSIAQAFTRIGYIREEGYRQLIYRRRSHARYAQARATVIAGLERACVHPAYSHSSELVTIDHGTKVQLLFSLGRTTSRGYQCWSFRITPYPLADFMLVMRLADGGETVRDYLVRRKNPGAGSQTITSFPESGPQVGVRICILEDALGYMLAEMRAAVRQLGCS